MYEIDNLTRVIFDNAPILNDEVYHTCNSFMKSTMELIDSLYENDPNDSNIPILENQVSKLATAIIDYEANNFVGYFDSDL